MRALVRHNGLRSFLLTEMVARMAKEILRRRFRIYLKPRQAVAGQDDLDFDIDTDSEISMVQVVVDLFNEILCTDCIAIEKASKPTSAPTSALHPQPHANSVKNGLSRPSEAETRSSDIMIPTEAPQSVSQSIETVEINYMTPEEAMLLASPQQPLRADGRYDAVPHFPHETSPTPPVNQTTITITEAQSAEAIDYDSFAEALERNTEAAPNTPQSAERPTEVVSAPAPVSLSGLQEYRVDVIDQGGEPLSYDLVSDAFATSSAIPPAVPPPTQSETESSASSSVAAPAATHRPANAYNFATVDAMSEISAVASSLALSARDVYNAEPHEGAKASVPISRRDGTSLLARFKKPNLGTPSEQESKFWDEAWKKAFEEKFFLALDTEEKNKGRYPLGHPKCLANDVQPASLSLNAGVLTNAIHRWTSSLFY